MLKPHWAESLWKQGDQVTILKPDRRIHRPQCCNMISPSLVPRLLPAFCRMLYKKQGESLEDFITCMMTYYVLFYVWFWIIELLPTHAVFARSTVLDVELSCRLSQRWMPLSMTGRSFWEAKMNNCESWQQLLQHEYGPIRKSQLICCTSLARHPLSVFHTDIEMHRPLNFFVVAS